MVMHACDSSNKGDIKRRTAVQTGLGKNVRPYPKNKVKRAGV
jgi:hypothetical protein